MWERVIAESTVRKGNKKRPTGWAVLPRLGGRQRHLPYAYVRDAKGGWSLTPSHAPLDSRGVAGRLTDTPCTVQYRGARVPLLSASTDTLVTSGWEKQGPQPLARHPPCPVWALTVWRPGPSRGHAAYACLTQARGRAVAQMERSDATSGRIAVLSSARGGKDLVDQAYDTHPDQEQHESSWLLMIKG